MGAVEEIQAAIDKLTGLRDSSPYIEMNGWLAEQRPGASGAIYDPEYEGITNDPLIVALHRTIAAQLMMLGHSLILAEGAPFMFSTYGCLSIALARAINEVAP